MPAPRDHRRHVGGSGRCEIGKIGVPLCKEVPSMALLTWIGNLGNLAASINGLDRADFWRLAPDGDCDPIVAGDVRELLAVAVDQEIERPTFVRISDDRRLRPTI